MYRLAAGRYVVVSESGIARVETPVEVKAGELTVLTVNMNVGSLKVSANLPGNDQQQVISIFEENRDMNGNRKRLDSAGASDYTSILPAGRYVIVAERGQLRAEATIEVRAGELTEYTLAMPENTDAPEAGQPAQ